MRETSEFKSPLSYSDRKMWIPETIKHPAKAHLGMIESIILEYTKEGDTILDPMAGIGSTGVIAMLHNRICIMIEYEEKFCKTIRANIGLNGKPKLMPSGHAEVIQGDARLLSRMFRDKADGVVFSPPYAEQNIRDISKEDYGSKRTDGMKRNIRQVTPYSESPNNIGNLKYGDVDAIVTSPPYAQQVHGDREKGLARTQQRYIEGKFTSVRPDCFFSDKNLGQVASGEAGYSTDKSNIGNLPFKADSIITSPPYEGSLEATSRHTKGGIPGRDKKLGQTGTYADIDSIVTSPPYSSDMSHGEGPHAVKLMQYIKEKEGHWPVDNETFRRYSNEWQRNPPEGRYSENKDNIGNLKGQTYLEAMKMVYQGCYAVLKENGIMVLITKNFIRNKKIIPLDEHTIQLCEGVGFKFVKRHYRKITNPSFWRTLYKKKYGIEIPFEDILVFIKPNGGV